MTTRLLSVAQASEAWGLTEYAIRAAMAAGEMPWVPVGARPLVKLEPTAIDEYKRRRLIAAQPAALITTRRKKRTPR